MAQKIAVVNQKGGVSKSTVVLCLGAGLADRGKNVLLADLDAQGSLASALDVIIRRNFRLRWQRFFR